MLKVRKSRKKKIWTVVLCGVMAAMWLSGCGSEDINIAEGMQFVKELDYQAALNSFAAAQEAGEDEKLLARGRGIAYMGLTQYEEAKECFLEALDCSNGLVEDMDYDINLYLAAVYTKTGQYREAEEIYNGILALKPEDGEVLFLRGSVRLKLDNYELAKADMDKVAELDGKNFERIIQIYEAMAAAGHKDSGQGYLTDALQTYEAEMSYFEKGRMFFYMGEYQKAYLALEEAKAEGGVEAYLYLGKAYEATGDYNYASSVYNSYLTKVGEDAQVYNQLGLCELKKGELKKGEKNDELKKEAYTNALNAFQAGLKVEDTTMKQVLLFNEIVAYEYLGNFEQAKALMKSYVTVYPDDAQAAREYEFLSNR